MKIILTVVAGIVIIFIALFLFSCNRKVNIQTSKTKVDSTYKSKYDSSVQVNKTLSEAYESLLQASSSTDVIFECPPCDSVRAQGMPHVFNRVIIDSRGNKTFEGAIKSYREAASVIEKKYYALQQTNDSLANAKAELEKNYSKLEEKKNKVVKITVFPWYLVVGGLVFLLLWFNERFNLFKIPLLTKK
jgi:hypothetical protein